MNQAEQDMQYPSFFTDTKPWRRLGTACALAAAALLAGCATGYQLDNTVQAFSSLQALPASLSYRFERLPSQTADAAAQQHVETLADPALFQAGFRRDDAAPRFAISVTARGQRVLSPWADPWYGGFGPWGPWGAGWNVGVGVGGRHGRVGLGFGGPMFPMSDQLWFHREVQVLVRELPANRVVWESRAVNDGPWMDADTVLAAMFQAAMNGFPNPPQGVRRVDMQVGGKPATK